MKKIVSLVLVAVMVLSVLPAVFAAENETVILYTNDIHCAIDEYPVLAAYKAEFEAQGKNVVVVDAGDAIQGEIIGAITQGEAVVDIMNAVGYDYAVPGNHEFDYGMERFLEIAQTGAEYKYISSNFYNLTTLTPVVAPYAIKDFGDYQIAFVGISTPETITKSTPEYFKDKNGNFIYGFPVYPGGMTDEILYENIQKSVDKAIDDGADIVVAVGHTGIIETNDGWKSTDIIANTDGIDYYIDAHSHETTESATYKNINDEDVILTSTGTKFAHFGILTISGDTADFNLIIPDRVDVETMSEAAKTAYNTVKTKVDGYNEETAVLYEEIGTSEVKLVAYDSDKSWAVRKRETNAGDFVADAYRSVTGADVAIANGGGIRADVESGAVSRKSLMDVNAFNNEMCVIEVTGQQLIDVLEHGARECPDPIGGFFQVSGVTFEIHTYRASPVVCDHLDNFIGINETAERRVENVLVGGEPVDLNAKYTLAGSAYVLTKGGDGLTMLDGAKVVQQEGLPCDSEMLIKYFTETLDGKITEEQYGNPYGDGRITILESEFEVPECDYEIEYGEKITLAGVDTDGTFIKFVPEKTCRYIFRTESDGVDTAAYMIDSNGEDVSADYRDDTEEGTDFILKCECEAGKTYYLHIYTYSDEAKAFDLVVECGHNYEDGICTVCGKECDHSETDFLGFCPCGKVYLAEDISDGDEFELEFKSGEEIFWYRFTPDVSGYYSFSSDSQNVDPDCFVYDANGECFAESLDIKGMDFDLIYDFEAGETYYFNVCNCSGKGAFAIMLDRIIHTTDDGSVHTDFEVIDVIYSNCTEHGFSNGLYCHECEEYVYGHEELPLDEYWHIDENGDDVCDLCGAKIYCEHMCHAESGFLAIIWRIANFFHKIFGIMPECECGEAHY